MTEQTHHARPAGDGEPRAEVWVTLASYDCGAHAKLRIHSVTGLRSVELSRNLVRLRTGEEGWRICPASLVARVPGKLTLTI